MSAEILANDALRALLALEQEAESLCPGIAGEDDVYPGGEPGMAGLALLSHMLLTGCNLKQAIKHLEGHCRDLEELQSDYRKAREEPLRLTLEELELAAANHFPPPQVTSNTLSFAIGRWKEGLDRWPGENGGMALASGRDMQRQRTKRRHQALARWFAGLHRGDPEEFPVSKVGFARASAVLEEEGEESAKPSTIEKAFMRSIHHKMLGWPQS